MDKHFDPDFGDLVPLILANALHVKVIFFDRVLDEGDTVRLKWTH